MVDLEDIGVERAEPGRNHAQYARPVGNGEAERDDALLALQFAHHDRGEDTGIDIAAAQDQADLFAVEAFRLGQHGGEPGGACALGHRLLLGQEMIHRLLELRLADKHDAGNKLAHNRQRQRADGLHRDAFGQRRPADRQILLMQRIPH